MTLQLFGHLIGGWQYIITNRRIQCLMKGIETVTPGGVEYQQSTSGSQDPPQFPQSAVGVVKVGIQGQRDNFCKAVGAKRYVGG